MDAMVMIIDDHFPTSSSNHHAVLGELIMFHGALLGAFPAGAGWPFHLCSARLSTPGTLGMGISSVSCAAA